ncbi:acyl-CoA N-acyltransferase [Auriculariales sp. MPI-PUGE-AT-0066]|nr:acyl-CoA N-acyltransferase [Auriculariales sp. MPI-PUGE-AT-0066]
MSSTQTITVTQTATTSKGAARVSLAPCTLNNVGTVRKLNSVLFPVRYAERFYGEILHPDAEPFCQLLYYNDLPVGTVCCRFETDDKGNTKLYIMTMGILAPYRGLGLGARCLRQVIDAADASVKPRLSSIYLHVQVSNEHARGFYEHHGFTQTRLQPNYYKKIEPRDAWVLERVVQSVAAAA